MANLLARTEETFLCLLLFAMIILTCIQIFLRTFFASGILWADQFLRHLVIWAGLFGAAAATKQARHISIDIVSHWLPERFLPGLRILLNLFSAGVCTFLTYAAVRFVRDEALYGGKGVLDIASWQLNIVFPLAFAIIAGRFLLLAVKDLIDIVRPQPAAGKT